MYITVLNTEPENNGAKIEGEYISLLLHGRMAVLYLDKEKKANFPCST